MGRGQEGKVTKGTLLEVTDLHAHCVEFTWVYT